MLANGSCWPLKSARRRATVTISAPLASSDCRINSGEANLPVPRISRERKLRPAMINGCSASDINGKIGGWLVGFEGRVPALHNHALPRLGLDNFHFGMARPDLLFEPVA